MAETKGVTFATTATPVYRARMPGDCWSQLAARAAPAAARQAASAAASARRRCMAPSTVGCRVATRLLALVHLDRDARRGDQPLGSGGRRRVDGHAPGVEAVLQDEGGGNHGAAVDGQIVEGRTRPGEAGPERVEAGALLVVERRCRRAGEAGAEEGPQRFARVPIGERGLVPQAFRVGAADEAAQA